MKSNRKRSNAGFTLAELMMTMVILLLVTAIVVSGMPTVISAYRRVIDKANAQILLSTAVTRLREELSTATDVEVDDKDNVLRYVNGERGYWSTLKNADDSEGEKGLTVTRTTRSEVEEKKNVTMPLVSSVNLTDKYQGNRKLYVTFEEKENEKSFTYKDGVFTIKNLAVIRPGYSTPIESLGTFTVNTVMAPEPTVTSTPAPAGG